MDGLEENLVGLDTDDVREGNEKLLGESDPQRQSTRYIIN